MKNGFKGMLKTLLACTLLGAGAATAQAAYPDKPVRLVVGFAPGGPVDVVARLLAEELRHSLGQQVIVENRVGAGGQIATQAVANAQPDGYTLLMTSSNAHGAGPALWPKVPYDPMKDFTHLALVAQSPIVLVARSDAPYATVKDVIDATRSSGKGVNFGSGGPGGMGHLTGELLQSIGGFRMTHVPYKGSSAALSDLLGGQIDVISDVMATYIPQEKSGAIKFLGVSTEKRVPQYPDLATFTEQGYPSVSSSWFGLTAPAGLPPEVVARLDEAMLAALQSPALRERFAPLGFIIDESKANSRAFTEFVRSELDKWAGVAKERGLKM
ncbi:tripartite tricarboxylate transporter substrate binding protein [Orrella sp. JC864]|uniref:Bug family tripartite tricarboxylate transporter substrate binding protein n=1 Tax=Orrella sp. JC864 TaxID=3120298 RepID=UPI0030089DD2